MSEILVIFIGSNICFCCKQLQLMTSTDLNVTRFYVYLGLSMLRGGRREARLWDEVFS